jgi:hypothetical protein
MNKNILLTPAAKLTLADRRLYNYLPHHAIPNLKKKLSFTIKLEELKGVYGSGLPPEDRLKESLRRLMCTLVEFETASGQWALISLLVQAEISIKDNQLHYTYPSYCQSLFTHPFTLEKCLIQAHFHQKYSNLLYDVLANTFYAGRLTLALEAADLRSRLHIPEKKLTNFGDFNRFALSPALDEINAYASFAVKFHTQRKGMKVTHVIFGMTEKRAITPNAEAQSVIPPKRPRLFIYNPKIEQAYAFLLNAETHERRKYFDLACKRAQKANQFMNEENFDRPDLWLHWVEKDLCAKKV